MQPLPDIMVAPNGARLTKADHPAIPVTVQEVVETAIACRNAGAGGIHAHVRDARQQHTLDAGAYRELIAELGIRVPDLQVQITTEAVGRYSPAEQRELVLELKPPSVSIALREIVSDENDAANRQLFEWANEQGVAIQHILYDASELRLLDDLRSRGIIPSSPLQLLFVLGRYTENQVSNPDDIAPFIAALSETNIDAEWAVCAFGINETACLIKAWQLGGKLRVGFENNRLNANGSTARDNAERVAELVAAIERL